MIPIHINDINQFSHKNYRIVLDVTNDTFEKRIVTSEDFKVKNIQDESFIEDSTTRKMFPLCSITKQFIDIVYLEPSMDSKNHDCIKLDCGMKIGTAKENGAYNVVSTCTYMNTPDNEEIEKRWTEIESKLPDDPETRNIKRKDFMNLDAERIYKHNSFDFKIQTLGVYQNRQIVRMACDIMISKLKRFYNALVSM